MSENVWLITGTSSGLGRDLALAAAKRGELVIATARKLEAIKDLASERIKTLQLDVTAPSPTLLVDATALFGRAPNVIVSNAGYGLLGPVEEITPDEWQAQFDTNVFGLVKTLKIFLPGVRSYKERGWVLNMSSMGGWWSSPLFAPYQATKHALTAINRSLASELEPFGTHVVGIEPGIVKTGFFSRNPNRQHLGYSLTQGRAPDGAYDEVKKEKQEGFRAFGGKEPTSSELCGERIVDLVRGEGGAKGKKVPLELALGEEAIKIMKDVFVSKIREMEEWREFSSDVKA